MQHLLIVHLVQVHLEQVQHCQFQYHVIQLQLVEEVVGFLVVMILKAVMDQIQFFQQLHQLEVEVGVQEMFLDHLTKVTRAVLVGGLQVMDHLQEEQEIHLLSVHLKEILEEMCQMVGVLLTEEPVVEELVKLDLMEVLQVGLLEDQEEMGYK